MFFPTIRRIPALLGVLLAILLSLAEARLSGAPAILAVASLDQLTGVSAIPAADSEAAFTVEAVTARRTARQIEATRARADLEKLPDNKADETALGLTQEIGLLARLDAVHAEQLRTLQHAADLAKEAAEVAARAQNPRPPETRLPTPRGLALLDQLYSERDYLIRAETLLKTDLENATTALDDARDDLADKDRRRRSVKEKTADDADANRPRPSLRLAELESRLGKETVILAEGALQTLRFQQSLLAPKLALVRPDHEWLLAHLVLSDADLAAAETKRAKRLAELDTALEDARAEADQVARLVIAAERRAIGTPAGQPTDEELESRRADRQTANLALGVLAAQRERQATFAEVAELRRRALTDQGSASDYKAWATANRDALERLQKSRRPQAAELRKSRQELQTLRARMADPAFAARAEPWVPERARRLAAWILINERELSDLAELTTARLRLKEELDARVFIFSLPTALATTWDRIVAAWDYEVFSIADQPVRVKTIFAVLVLLFTGHWVSRRVSDLAARTLFRRLGMNVGHSAAWQTLSFYALFLVVLLVATNLFHLSLTQFSVVSGALAVGIGFGSQTLIGNFISGIILLLERPVNQGDVIEIDGQQMTVERLGPRSTVVRTFDNAQIIVPNSRLLEENVINWTLSDDIVRTRIEVGVAYGSPTREVARLLEEVLLGLEDVKREPAPLVLFTAFGESALNFQASFWSALQGRKELECELRHRIAESFVAAGIVMAFPQRDVHLATSAPLRVEVVSPAQCPLPASSPPSPPAATPAK